MQIRISILEGKDAGERRTFLLKEGEQLLLGRCDECDLPIWDESASRRHALLERSPEGLQLTDLGSANGTRVDGSPIERRIVSGGERISIGSTVLRLETERFQERATAVLRGEDGFTVESSLSREEVDLGTRLTADQGRGDRLNQLLSLVETVQGEESGDGILRTLLSRALSALGAERGGIALAGSSSREPLWPETLRHPSPGDAPPPSSSVVERVLAQGNALLVTDVRQDPRTRDRESIVGRGVISVVAAPIVARDQVHGVLVLERDRDQGRFAEEDLAYLATLAQIVGMALANAERLQESRRLLRAHERASPVRILVESPSMRRALDLLDRFAATGGPLLITGETGCGKELLARRAHLKGPHRDGPWIPLNCAAIPPGLLESELFGHEKGAFTGATGRRRGMFELAHRGTLFLDEIGDLPMELQPKLLRVLESGEFFRIGGRAPVCVELLLVSATHRDLEERSAAGDFREDLFFRLSRFRVDVPPLRERPEDIRLLACHFLDRVGRQGDKPAPALSPGALEALIAYPWPGNVRELRNVLERACVLGGGKEISTAGLSLTAPGGRRGDDAGSHGSPPRSIKAVEEEAIRVALRHTGGRKGDAAKLLGISWPTLRRKLKRYQIDPTAP